MRFTNAFLLLVALAFAQPLLGAETPPFREVYDLLRTNLAGVNESQLDRASVTGLIDQLKPKVVLLEGQEGAGQTNGAALQKSSVFDSAYGYLRVNNFADGAEKSFIETFRQLAKTNRLKGLVVDLRYSHGQDYSEAAAMADWFFSRETPLLDWGDGLKKAKAKSDAVELPLAVLVNRKTSGAAEAFAAILREAQIGVVIGTNTAGEATIGKEFTLSTGQRLRVATAPLKLASGKPLPNSGLKPDIYVEVSADDESAWFEDAYKVVGKPARAPGIINTNDLMAALSTNRSGRRRLNEAELVRMLREGLNPENETAAGVRELERTKGLVNDPVLGRALDLLKGLTVVQHFKPS
jgi:hypothetical protein